MGRRSKFIRDVERGRKEPRDRKLPKRWAYKWMYGTSYPVYSTHPYYHLYKKLKKEGGVAHGD